MPYRHHRYVKRSLAFYDKGPGPARYNLQTLIGMHDHDFSRRQRPAFTLAPKLYVGPFYHPETIGPGPAYCIQHGQKAIGSPHKIAYSFPHKYPPNDIPFSVGPAHYSPKETNVYRYKFPAWTLHSKHKILKKGKYPSPTDHDLPLMMGPKVPTRTAAVECTMKGDFKDRSYKASPGPVYQVGDPLKKRMPAWHMTKRHPAGPLPNPDLGPCYYTPFYDPVLPKQPRAHLGIRYNHYTGVLKTACDIF